MVMAPPVENGEIEEEAVPAEMQANSVPAGMPVLWARAGTSGNIRGHTTPEPLAKKLRNAPMMTNAGRISHTGMLLLRNSPITSTRPAFLATFISSVKPAIITIVLMGILL